MSDMELFKETLLDLPKEFNGSLDFISPIVRFVNAIFYLAVKNEAEVVVLYKNELFFQTQELVPFIKLSAVEVQILNYRVLQMGRMQEDQTSGVISNFNVGGKIINVHVYLDQESLSLTLSPVLQ